MSKRVYQGFNPIWSILRLRYQYGDSLRQVIQAIAPGTKVIDLKVVGGKVRYVWMLSAAL